MIEHTFLTYWEVLPLLFHFPKIGTRQAFRNRSLSLPLNTSMAIALSYVWLPTLKNDLNPAAVFIKVEELLTVTFKNVSITTKQTLKSLLEMSMPTEYFKLDIKNWLGFN